MYKISCGDNAFAAEVSGVANSPYKVAVFVIAGQSNTHFGKNDVPTTAPLDRLYQVARGGANDGTVVPVASLPLDFSSATSDRAGFGALFASKYATDNPTHDVILVPTGVGSTSLKSGAWRKGGNLYQDTIARVAIALAHHPDAFLAGVLWHQGESDVGNAQYQSQLDAMIADMRSDIGVPDVPFLLGTLSPLWLENNQSGRDIDTIIRGTPSRVPNTTLVDAADYPLLTKYMRSEEIHFSYKAQRVLADRYYRAFLGRRRLEAAHAISFTTSARIVVAAGFDVDSYIVRYSNNGTDMQSVSSNGELSISGLSPDTSYSAFVYGVINGVETQPLPVQFRTMSEAPKLAIVGVRDKPTNEVTGNVPTSVVYPDLSTSEHGWYKYYNVFSGGGGLRTDAVIRVGDAYKKVIHFTIETMPSSRGNLVSSNQIFSHHLSVFSDGRIAAGHGTNFTVVESAPGKIQAGVWYTAEVEYDGSNLSLHLDEELIASAAVAPIPVDGAVQVFAAGSNAVIGAFDYVLVT